MPLNVESVSGSATVGGVFPYSRNIEDAEKEVKAGVADLMIDQAAEKFRDDRLARMRQELDGKLLLVSYSPGSHDRVLEHLVDTKFRKALDGKVGYKTTSNRDNLEKLPRKIFVYSGKLDKKTNGNIPFSSEFTVGTLYGHYNVLTRQNYNYTDDYTIGIDGIFTWTVDGALDAKWTLNGKTHQVAKGVDSVLSMKDMSNALEGSFGDVKDYFHSPIDKVYDDEVKNVIYDIKLTLDRRLSSKREMETFKDVTYNVNFETAVSRLQRLNDDFKYDKDASTFIYNEKTYTKNFIGKSTSLKSNIIVKLFPEKSATAVKYQIKYSRLRDKLTDRDLFGLEDAAAEHVKLIAAIEGVLNR